MAKTTTVTKSLIPYEAGVTIITPLDKNHRPMLERAVATQYNYVASTQVVVTKTTEELENGNGQNKTMVTAETYNFTLNVNALNIVFHNTVAGRIETLPEKTLVLDEFTWFLPDTVPTDGDLSITFGADKDHKVEPAAREDGEFFFVVEDSYGNPLVRRDTPENGAYAWDKDTKKLSFSDEYAGAAIRVIYEYADSNSIRYDSNPLLSQPEYQIDVFGITTDAETDQKFKVHERILRASYSGDLSGMPTQKSRAATIAYTFASTPVPSGSSVYTVTYTPLDSDDGSSDAYMNNIVNGGDDKFGTTPVGP